MRNIPKEEATVETVRALKKWHKYRHLTVRHCGQLLKWTQGNGGSRKKLAAACRGMNQRAIPSWFKFHSRKGIGRDKVAKGTPKGRTIERGQRTRQEDSNGIKNRDIKEKLCLRKEDNWQRHQKTEQETGAMSGKQDNTWQDFQQDRTAGGHKANSWDFH
jgi:hypothetical protein